MKYDYFHILLVVGFIPAKKVNLGTKLQIQLGYYAGIRIL